MENFIFCAVYKIILLQNSNTWKTQSTIPINFVSSKYTEEECVMHSRSNKI